MSEVRQGRLYWSHKEYGNSLVAEGRIGTQILIDELSTAKIKEETKENSIKLVEMGRLLVRRFLEEGGLIGLDGKPFIQGLDNLDGFLYNPENFRGRLKRDVVMSYRSISSRGISRIDPQLDIQKLGIHPNRTIYFVNEHADQALGYRVTSGGAVVFGVLNNGWLIEGNVSPIQRGLTAVIKNDYIDDRGRIAVALATVVNQSMYDLAEEARVSLIRTSVVARKSEGLLSRMLKLFHLAAVPL